VDKHIADESDSRFAPNGAASRATAAPAFGKAHAHELKFGCEVTEEIVRWGMESQRRRHEVGERPSLLQNDPWKIAIASDLSALQLPANVQPTIGSLPGEVDVLAGLQFHDR
jgi:hypothetical protein